MVGIQYEAHTHFSPVYSYGQNARSAYSGISVTWGDLRRHVASTWVKLGPEDAKFHLIGAGVRWGPKNLNF